ncbi:hypothetical protein C5167_034867 [Papaver somniferum]|uniref:DDT domain-containing protein n=1 Tax=Papaver somniferum TaxID=3469 RepID=A0A4Y7KI13_PAPSO|nr:DDT domain-containing protein DDR4-like [Papaver somniferum]RZC71708.1 hypothetical protein C5167_034867 [Papaver somniferum]
MTEKRGRGKPPKKTEKEDEVEVIEVENEDPATEKSALSESQIARNRLRERWELASVLNFLQVFKPVLEIDMEISAEDIETGLIRPNDILSQLHISLLKGIPPVSKTLTDPDVWVTILCKKLDEWWQWVAEGKFPLGAFHGGEEISRYKDLDPTVRLVILKALCEVRADQNDALDYVHDALKTGTEVSTFRKDQIGENGKGTAYWYDGDSVIGFRLYKEVTRVNYTPRKGKGRLAPPPNSSQWETLATNLEEFGKISSELSSSKVLVEAAVGKVVENDIIPVLVKLQKKKERALKRQQTQVMLLHGLLNSHHIGANRPQRNRKPVSYTFDDYDQSIDEALQIGRTSNRRREQKEVEKKDGSQEGKQGSSSDSSAKSSSLVEKVGDVDDKNDEEGNTEDENDSINDIDDKFQGSGGEDDSDDHNYDDKTDEEDNDENENDNDNESDENFCGSEKENIGHDARTRLRNRPQKRKGLSANDIVSLRRSKRTARQTNMESGNHVNSKRTLRLRHPGNTRDNPQVV